MKSSTSVVLLGPVLFILMAFAIYIFHSFPYLLALVLLAEWIAVAMTVFGPAFDLASRPLSTDALIRLPMAPTRR